MEGGTLNTFLSNINDIIVLHEAYLHLYGAGVVAASPAKLKIIHISNLNVIIR